MIDRYCTNEMAEIWSDVNKLLTWLKVELAALKAKSEMGLISTENYRKIKGQANFFSITSPNLYSYLDGILKSAAEKNNISEDFRQLVSRKLSDLFKKQRIMEIEKEIKHDLLAFVEAVRESLDKDVKGLFHQDMTSFDTEEPAFALLIIDSIELITISIAELASLLFNKAKEYRDLTKIERSHGQHAEPNALGILFLWWFDSLERQLPFLKLTFDQIKESKISGAIGTYTGNLTPELEEKALGFLGLKPARISMQIILRDRHAHVTNTLAVIAGVLENMALNIRLLSQTEICEIQEPFSEKQKGSSRMPHKKNPILSENMCGLARIVRHDAGMALENIPTWGGRDISHSSVERVIFPDCFNLVHFMLKRMKKVIEGLVVNKDNIARNLEFTKWVIFSPEVNELLVREGIDPETAYRISQQCAFEAIKQKIPFLTILVRDDRIPFQVKNKLPDIFNLKNKLTHLDEIYQRFGL